MTDITASEREKFSLLDHQAVGLVAALQNSRSRRFFGVNSCISAKMVLSIETGQSLRGSVAGSLLSFKPAITLF